LVLAALLGTGMLPAVAQTPTPTPSGEFLCTVAGGAAPDGKACISDDDCTPNGVCVIAQPVCNGGTNDGAYCGCIGVACVAVSPACDPSANGGLGGGVCPSGPNETECCDVTANCGGGAPCVGAQKVCLSGRSKAVSCLNDNQCGGAVCGSTGKFCNGGDANLYACVDDGDCTGTAPTANGTCEGAAGPTTTPTKRPATPLPTPTVTSTRAPGTVVATGTPTPVPTAGAVASLASGITASALIIPLDNAASLPASGTVQIDGEQIIYLSKVNNTLTNVRRGANGTAAAPHALGAPVFLLSGTRPPTPTPAGNGDVSVTGHGSGCSLAAPTARADGGVGVAAAAVLLSAWRRRRAR
jgi:hypothetical protein